MEQRSPWENCSVIDATELPYNIDGNCVYRLPYDPSKMMMMKSSVDGRPWKQWVTSSRGNYVVRY